VNRLLDDKVVVVTGGAGLIGRDFSRGIAESGGLAVVADRDKEAAARAAAEVAAENSGRVEAVALDITNPESVKKLVQELQARHGHIDAVVNNAYPRNCNFGRSLEDVAYADFYENVGTHIGGYFLVSQQFGIFFRGQGHGNIVNMASIYGFMAPRFGVYAGTSMTMPVEYAAIKSAIIHLTRYLAQYFKGSGVRVNCLSPGGVWNEQERSFVDKYASLCRSKGLLEPSDVTGCLLFLLSDASEHMTGHNLVVDDGFSI